MDAILQIQDSFLIQELHKKAQQTATQIYGNKIYIRGLIEFTNYCKNNCYYCGIRNGNTKADRYPVVKPDGIWDFVHLYYREERIPIIQM